MELGCMGEFERRARQFGCVRVHKDAQPLIFSKVVVGTPIEIVEESLVAEMNNK